MLWPLFTVTSIIISTFSLRTWGFIPAQAVNLTQGSSLDVHDNSSLELTWNPNGLYTTVVSYQLYGNGSYGVSKGALIRIQEEDIVNNDTTTTPWIALINCDKNATNMSLEVDIFTMVRDRGAKAALLYSNTSDGCLINEEYLNGGDFEHIFDIVTTKKAATALLIQSQFTNVNNYSYTLFNPLLLNQSYNSVVSALPRSADNQSPYLVATLRAANATSEEDPNDPNPVPTTIPSPTATPNQSHSSDPSQSLAMIILYVIVSLVATLFIIVILSGAVRAFRHPERYGPRLYDPTVDGEDGQYRGRASGITRAILDTFPVVKFGRSGANTTMEAGGDENQRHELKAWESDGVNNSRSSAAELLRVQRSSSPLSSVSNPTTTAPYPSIDGRGTVLSAHDAASTAPTSAPRGSSDTAPLDPAAIGKETCPICIVDFEEGDDLRVLPCDGHHRFHKDCVDPWLLELSTSCPICREDFQALENMAAAGTEEDPDDDDEEGEDDRFEERPGPSTTPTSRFSRYIRFAQKRRRSQRNQRPPSSTANRTSAPPVPYTDY